MKKIVKLFALLLCLSLMFGLLSACGSDDGAETAAQDAAEDTAADTVEEETETEEESAEESTDETDYGTGESTIYTSDHDDSFTRQTEEGTLIIGTNSAVDTFNPLESQAASLMMVYDTLLEIDPETKELVGCLAESWEWSDDYLTCTFKIRENATFSDGTPVTAEDVLYDVKAIATSTSLAASYYENVDLDASNCPDDKTFVLVLTEVYAQMEYTLTTMWIYPQAFAETATADDWWSNPVGSGAYTVVENVDGAYTKLQAREDYWRGEAEAKEVTMKYFGDSTAEFIAYQAGELDVAMNILSSDAERIVNNEEKNSTLVIASSYDFKAIALCDYVEAFQNENVRKAVAYAIDREALVESTYGLLGSVMQSNLNDSCSYYQSVGIYEYDPEKAIELLEQEGYSAGDISLRMVIFNTTTDTLLAEAIQAYLAAVGIDMTIESYIMPTAIPMLRDGECDITLTGTGGGAYDAAQVFDKIDDSGTDLSTIIHDDELQALIDEGSSTMDPEARAEIYAQAQQIMFEKCYSVPIANINGAYCYRDYIESMPCLTAEKINAWYCSFAE